MAIWSPPTETLVILDYKFGYQAVYADDWPQGMLYADAVINEHLCPPPARIILAVVQPARDANPSTAVVDPWELAAFRVELSRAAAAASRPGAPRIAGRHCQWCPARGACSTFAASLLDALPDLEAEAYDDTVANAGPERLAEWLRLLPLVETWTAAVRERALFEARAGATIPGFKLVQGAGRSRIADPDALATLLIDRFAYRPEQLFEPSFRWTVADVRRLARTLPWDQADEILPFIVRPASAPELVPATDPRETATGDLDLDALPDLPPED